MLVTVDEAKLYLRIDNELEDTEVEQLLTTSEQLVQDIARTSEWEGKEPIIRPALLYATAFLYEHREEVDFEELRRMLRSLLIDVRTEVF